MTPGDNEGVVAVAPPLAKMVDLYPPADALRLRSASSAARIAGSWSVAAGGIAGAVVDAAPAAELVEPGSKLPSNLPGFRGFDREDEHMLGFLQWVVI